MNVTSLLLALAQATAAPAPAAPTPVASDRAPAANRWIVDFGESRCTLIRETGGERSKALLVRTVPGTRVNELWLMEKQRKAPSLAAWAAVDVVVRPAGQVFGEDALPVSFRDYGGVAVTNVEEPLQEAFRTSTGLSVERKGKTVAEISYPHPGRALQVLERCEKEILRDWGFDPAAIDGLRSRPQPVASKSLWTSGDYPADALRAAATGSVLVRLVIDVEGRVSECHLVESSGHASLDAATCRILRKRGRYRPAVGADGAPMRALTAQRVNWRIG